MLSSTGQNFSRKAEFFLYLTLSNLGDSILLSNLGGGGGGIHLSIITAAGSLIGFQSNFSW